MDFKQSKHTPILKNMITQVLMDPFFKVSQSNYLLDCTLGGGGHTAALIECLPFPHKIIGIDQDKNAIQQAHLRFFKEIQAGRLILIHGRISELEKLCDEKPVLGILADLGFSSDQIEDPSRGFSFRLDGPVDMRFDTTRGMSAFELLKIISEKDLEKILRQYGEERYARRIAARLNLLKKKKQLPSHTQALAQAISQAVPSHARYQRIHPATRSFQALRMKVNQELEELDVLLNRLVPKLQSQGRVAILDFHSLEDRMIKHYFKSAPFLKALFKKPIRPSVQELKENPRARSAKLRVAEKIET